MSEELKPCPFCGEAPQETPVMSYRTQMFVMCRVCRAEGPRVGYKLGQAAGAIAAWNRRTASTIPASEAGELPATWESRTKFRDGGYCETSEAMQSMQAEIKEWRARAALVSTRTVSEPEIVTAGDCMARWLYGLSQSEAMPESWRTTCEELAQAWKGTATDTRTAAGEAECDAALGRAVSHVELMAMQVIEGANAVAEIKRRLTGMIGNGDMYRQGYKWALEMVGIVEAKFATQAATTRLAEVDVEAERKLFEAAHPTFSTIRPRDGTYCAWLEDRWQGWLAKARTQADAGRDRPSPPREKQ